MRRKKETNVNGEPTSKTRACTNNSKNVTRSQETRVRTVGSGEGKDSQSTARTRKWGHGGSEEAEEDDDDDDVELLAIAQASKFVSYVQKHGRKRRTCTGR